MADQIHYLRARLAAARGFSPIAADLSAVELVGHFYLVTDDSTSAGAVAHGICAENGLTFEEYLVLPQPLDRSKISAHESEHLRAFDEANSSGAGVVISVVWKGWNET